MTAALPRTVLVTGASGYIAKHIVRQLLDAGHRVVASTRRPEGLEAIRAAVGPRLADPGTLDRLSGVTLDLLRDDGWDAAMGGVDALMHTASPFPLAQPKNADELIRPAVDGTLRALRASAKAGVGRAVITSSIAAISSSAAPADGRAYAEGDWTDLTYPTTTPYVASKTLAERAARDFVRDEAPGMRLVTVNPGFVLGPPLDADVGTSMEVVMRLMRGKDPMVPRVGFVAVDVADVAAAHVAAMDWDGPEDRFMLAARFVWFVEFARALKAAFPDRKIPVREAPDLLIRALALFDPSLRTITPNLGRVERFDNSRARALLGRDLADPLSATVASARALVDLGLLR
jgi:dihydroflavonol-4-reductase